MSGPGMQIPRGHSLHANRRNGQFSEKYGSGPPPPTHSSPKSPFQGLFEYTPHSPPPPPKLDTQRSQMRRQRDRLRKTLRVGIRPADPARYAAMSGGSFDTRTSPTFRGHRGGATRQTGPMLPLRLAVSCRPTPPWGGGVRVGQRQSSGRIEEGQRRGGGACHQGRGGLPVGASGGAPWVGLLEGSRPRCSSRATGDMDRWLLRVRPVSSTHEWRRGRGGEGGGGLSARVSK